MVVNELQPEDLTKIFEQKNVPNKVKQEYFNRIIAIKHEAKSVETKAEQV